MMAPFNGSIVVTQNPLTSWEHYGHTFWRARVEGFPGYRNYQHEIRAEGGFITAQFSIFGPVPFLQDFFSRGLTRMVSVYDPTSIQIWEGFIAAMTYVVGPYSSLITVDNLFNRSWARYRTIGGSTTLRSTTIEDTTSQARFGVKEWVWGLNEVDSLAVADAMVQTYLNLHRMPKPTPAAVKVQKGQIVVPHIEVQCRGYWDTLTWQIYNQTVSTGSQGAAQEVSDILTAKCQFITGWDVMSNSTNVAKVYDTDRSSQDILNGIMHLGNGDYNRCLIYCTFGRRVVYDYAAPAVYPPVV